MTSGDLPFADALRKAVGWNQTIDDWRRYLAWEPRGCFVAEWDGHPAGTATTLAYGTELAWIGMVLVQAEYRRRGIGRALLHHCIHTLEELGIRSIRLDATPDGQKIYEPLWFRAEWTLTRWEHRAWDGVPCESGGTRNAVLQDIENIVALDATAFGVTRRDLLIRLLAASDVALTCEDAAGRVRGLGFVRPGSRAWYLGPVIAEDDASGLLLIEALLGRLRGKPVYWDVPEPNLAASAWAREHNFVPQRLLTRMARGTSPPRADPQKQFALAGPEMG